MKLQPESKTTQPQAQPFPQPAPPPEFPGCRPITIKRGDIDAYDGRLEYWDADTEIAWVVREPTGIAHERPSQCLGELCAVVAALRGSPIRCYGSMDLELHDSQGRRRRILQADQSVYLHPVQARLPEAAGLVIGRHDFPDVVVEVDNTTDVRRGKLGLYEQWGFPEVWVDVPEAASPSRPAGRRPGLVIHLLQGGAYRPAPVSQAFPGWTALEIHTALNEPVLSASVSQVLKRVGRTLGEREGTDPDDTPWLHSQREEGRAKGQAEGYAKGRAEGRAKGRAKGRAEGYAEGRAEARVETMKMLIGKVLGIDAGDLDLTGVSDEAVTDALLQCEGEADFRAWLRDQRR